MEANHEGLSPQLHHLLASNGGSSTARCFDGSLCTLTGPLSGGCPRNGCNFEQRGKKAWGNNKVIRYANYGERCVSIVGGTL
jgi:hypothetical protein